jgi:RNA polymerase sigma-70 factor (ECF subfamily)
VSDTDDATLLRRWKQGDEHAGTLLVRRHFAVVYRFFRTKLDDELDDLVQQTFLACFEFADRFDPGRGSFAAFALGIGRKKLLLALRKRMRHARATALEAVCAADVSPNLSRPLALRQQATLLLEALRRLPLDQQIIVELHYWEALKLQEIALILDVPAGTVKSRLSRARNRLRELILSAEADMSLRRTTIDHFERWASCLRQRLRADARDNALLESPSS